MIFTSENCQLGVSDSSIFFNCIYFLFYFSLPPLNSLTRKDSCNPEKGQVSCAYSVMNHCIFFEFSVEFSMDDFARSPLKKRKKFVSHLKISPFRQRTDSPTLVGTGITQKTQPVLLLVSLEGDLLLVAR